MTRWALSCTPDQNITLLDGGPCYGKWRHILRSFNAVRTGSGADKTLNDASPQREASRNDHAQSRLASVRLSAPIPPPLGPGLRDHRRPEGGRK